MKSFPESMTEYKKLLKKGDIIVAHQGLMDYIRDLRTHFNNRYPDYSVPGNIYYGYMDMTYFAIIPESLKSLGLKIAIVFIYEEFRFEVWLAARNKEIQNRFRKKLLEQNWSKHHITEPGKGIDSILDSVLIENPEFRDLEILTKRIESRVQGFIMDVEDFLAEHYT